MCISIQWTKGARDNAAAAILRTTGRKRKRERATCHHVVVEDIHASRLKGRGALSIPDLCGEEFGECMRAWLYMALDL